MQLDGLLVLRRERVHLLGQVLALLEPRLATAAAVGLLLHLDAQLGHLFVFRVLHLLHCIELLTVSLDELLLEFLNLDAHQIMFILQLSHVLVFVCKFGFLLIAILLGQTKLLLYQRVNFL